MKVAVFGDLHLSRPSPRYEHALYVLDRAIRDAREQNAEAFVFLGDVFEGKPAPREYADFIGIMLDLVQDGQVFIVRGNHEDFEAYSFFEGISPLIRVAWETFEMVGLDTLRLLLVPYPVRQRRPFEDLDDTTIASSMRAAADRIRSTVNAAALDKRLPLVVLGHFTIEGMTTRDTEFELHQANEVVVPVDAFALADLTLVGHIHRAQEVTPTILGVGDLYRTSFAEAEDEKSYVLIQARHGEPLRWERRTTEARPMLDLAVELDEISAAWIATVVQQAKGKEVKIRVSMEAEQAGRYDPAVLEPIRAVAAYMPQPERVVRPKQRVRAPEVSRAMTTGDQLLSWMRATDQPMEPERVERLLAKLQEVQG